MSPPDTPVVIFGAGQRCGSTLLQRLFCSHPEAFLWGEHGGNLPAILTAVDEMRARSRNLGLQAHYELSRYGPNAFIANLIAKPAALDHAAVAFVRALFSPPDGQRVWGFKEVRYDYPTAVDLHRLLPDLRVVALVRDPRSTLSSIDEWERLGVWAPERTPNLIDTWQRVAASFAATATATAGPAVLRFRYEDLVADPDASCQALAKFTGLDAAGFDRDVFVRRVHMHGPAGRTHRPLRQWSDLPDRLRTLLDTPAVRQTAATYGYHLDSGG